MEEETEEGGLRRDQADSARGLRPLSPKVVVSCDALAPWEDIEATRTLSHETGLLSLQPVIRPEATLTSKNLMRAISTPKKLGAGGYRLRSSKSFQEDRSEITSEMQRADSRSSSGQLVSLPGGVQGAGCDPPKAKERDTNGSKPHVVRRPSITTLALNVDEALGDNFDRAGWVSRYFGLQRVSGMRPTPVRTLRQGAARGGGTRAGRPPRQTGCHWQRGRLPPGARSGLARWIPE